MKWSKYSQVRALFLIIIVALTTAAWAGTPLTPPPDERPELPRDADHALRVEVTWIWGLPGITLLTSQRTAEWNEYSFKQAGDADKLFQNIQNGLDERRWKVTNQTGSGQSRKVEASKKDMGLTISLQKDAKVGPKLVVEIGKTR